MEPLERQSSGLLYVGDDAWVEPTVKALHPVLEAPDPPATAQNCDYCQFVRDASR